MIVFHSFFFSFDWAHCLHSIVWLFEELWFGWKSALNNTKKVIIIWNLGFIEKSLAWPKSKSSVGSQKSILKLNAIWTNNFLQLQFIKRLREKNINFSKLSVNQFHTNRLFGFWMAPKIGVLEKKHIYTNSFISTQLKWIFFYFLFGFFIYSVRIRFEFFSIHFDIHNNFITVLLKSELQHGNRSIEC